MAFINYKIEDQNFAPILIRIGEILTLELENQFVAFYNSDCSDIGVYIEHADPVNFTEMAMITISLERGTYDNRNAGYVDGKYIYNIDVYTNSKSIGDLRGDKLSAVRNHRITGLVRAILEDPIYKTLGFTPGFCGNLRVNSIEFGEIKNATHDSRNCFVGQVKLEFKAQETAELTTGVPLLDSITQIKLGISDKGLKFVYGTDGPFPPDDRYVKIINQFGEVKALLQPPAIYTVEDLQAIIDTITENEVTIIDPLI